MASKVGGYLHISRLGRLLCRRLLQISLLVALSVGLGACGIRRTSTSYMGLLMQNIHSSVPGIDPAASLVSLRYDAPRDTLTATIVDPVQMKQFMVTRVENIYDIALVRAIDADQIRSRMACNHVFDAVTVDPSQAINLVNQTHSTKQDIALFAPYLDDATACEAEWSVIGPDGVYMVDAETGAIVGAWSTR
jgi:hypothetical protein